MVDLFAVLAIVFMIYSSDEIIASQEQSQETIEQIATDYKKLQEEVAAAEQAGQDENVGVCDFHGRRARGIID